MPRLAEIADWDALGTPPKALASLDPSARNRILDAASAIALGFLGDQYTLPIVGPVDDSVKLAVVQIANYLGIARRGYNPEQPGDLMIRQLYEDGVSWLKAIANGQRRLPQSGGQAQTNPASFQPSVSSNEQRGYGNLLPGATDAPIIGPGGNWGG